MCSNSHASETVTTMSDIAIDPLHASLVLNVRFAAASRTSAEDAHVKLFDICEASGVARTTVEQYIRELAPRLHEIRPDLATPTFLNELTSTL